VTQVGFLPGFVPLPPFSPPSPAGRHGVWEFGEHLIGFDSGTYGADF
jgi:hypothetical protein